MSINCINANLREAPAQAERSELAIQVQEYQHTRALVLDQSDFFYAFDVEIVLEFVQNL